MGEARMLNSAHDHAIWVRLIKRFGGLHECARRLGYSRRALEQWRSGYRSPTVKTLDRLLELLDDRTDRTERDALRSHILVWREAAAEKRAVRIRKQRRLFFERMGHMLEDYAGGVWTTKPTKRFDPDLREMVDVPGSVIPSRTTLAQRLGRKEEDLGF
jgi:transcriptional regulator with XRE-family HTH domain